MPGRWLCCGGGVPVLRWRCIVVVGVRWVRVFVGLVPVVVVTVVLGLASLALAAFPGANGLLAVQPQAGGGIVLVGANGRGARRICVAKARCGTPVWPRWSPDGRALVFDGPGIRIVYPDGSCLNCQFGAAPNPAFGAEPFEQPLAAVGAQAAHIRYPGGDHERLVGAGERAAEGLDRFAVGVGGARPTAVHASTWT
jgi:hypothetical protein